MTLDTCPTVCGTARTTPADHASGLFLIKRGPPDVPARHLAFTVPSAPGITTHSCQNNYSCTTRPRCKYDGLLKRAWIPKIQNPHCINISWSITCTSILKNFFTIKKHFSVIFHLKWFWCQRMEMWLGNTLANLISWEFGAILQGGYVYVIVRLLEKSNTEIPPLNQTSLAQN